MHTYTYTYASIEPKAHTMYVYACIKKYVVINLIVNKKEQRNSPAASPKLFSKFNGSRQGAKL